MTDGGATDPDAALAQAGLEVSAAPPDESGPLYLIRGNTFVHKDALKEAGGRWSASRRAWVFRGAASPAQALAERLANGLAEAPAAFKSDGGDKPHYWGHRQRLRDRFMAGGAEPLPDYELLELLLFFSIPKVDTKPIAKALLARFGSLGAVLDAEPARLEEVEQVGHFTIVQFKAMRALIERVLREEIQERPVITSWTQLVDYLGAAMAHGNAEQFRILFLDRKNILIRDEVQQRGTVDHTPLYPREVVKRALELGASAIIMAHNHPSGDPTPSKADVEMTRQVVQALGAVGIQLHDHVVVGKGKHLSFRGAKLL